MSRRTKRINGVLRQELSRIIQLELRDPRLHSLISITRVEVSEDLRYARIHISVMGDMDKKASALKGLTSATGYIRKEVGNVIPLRHIPNLVFLLDESLEREEAISRIVNPEVYMHDKNGPSSI